jgi:hypothetical protein
MAGRGFSKPLSPFELLDRVGGDRKTLKRTLTGLQEQGLLGFQEGIGHTAPGNPSGLWSLTTKGTAAATSASRVFEDGGGATAFHACSGQTWVTATVPDNTVDDLRRVAAQGDLTAAASCAMRLDGAQRRYSFVFARELGDQPAESLRAALEALGLACTLEVVGPVQSPQLFADSAKVAIAAARRAEEQRSR